MTLQTFENSTYKDIEQHFAAVAHIYFIKYNRSYIVVIIVVVAVVIVARTHTPHMNEIRILN